MKISKKDALMWFEFFASLPCDQQLLPRQEEIVIDVLSQIEDAQERKIRELYGQLEEVYDIGGRSFFVGDPEKISDGCRACLTDSGLNAIRKTNRCNLQCPFCYNWGELDEQPPIGEGYWEIGGSFFRIGDIPELIRIQGAPKAVAYVYLEPFMEIEKYYGIIKVFSEAGVHQHMYTNGTLADRENLRRLGEAGLNELRFNLGATNCSDRVIASMALAKNFIPKVGIETPMTGEFYESFLEKKDQILSSGIDFMNLAELHLNENNLGNYLGENMYMYRRGYLSPVSSHILTLDIMKRCVQEGWDIAVHDCCDRTKFMRGLNLRAHEGGCFGSSEYAMEFDTVPYEAFLPILRDPDFFFTEEEPLPAGYGIGEIFF
ncbi:MAG: radical SAM protein [Eubacteriaceae bacterium]|nr:radical SAM protein [Eubacteriaceae bacterium]